MKRSAIAIIIVLLLSSTLSSADDSAEKFGPEIFQARRQALLDSLGTGLALLYSSGEYGESGYRADGHFWYLTGNDDPGAILMLAPGFRYEQVLLLQPRDPEGERWTGIRPSLTDSLEKARGYDLICRTDRLDDLVVSCMKQSPVMHLISPLRAPSDDIPADLEYYNKASDRIPDIDIINSSRFIEQMRMIKSADEVAAIEKAIEVTHAGITDLLSAVTPGITEFQLEGILEQSFKRQGAQHMAFPPIVGSGERSAILHYEKKDQRLESGQLLLVDAGAEWDHYCADISRTFPVDGKFSDRQTEIYDLVLEAQDSAFAAIRPGVTVREIHEATENVFRKSGYIDYFVHGTSHHLGVDAHDDADYNLILAEGMILTVEPGIYIDQEKIGIRIEDDFLVTEKGYRLLSAHIPRERAAVERWMSEARNPSR
ncbi:MAG: aminopeptidase P family protein [Candidatus Zixiibacteriota bacterium]|nr:MAG: aminopeptidase P family protein [candidate division Zixibacteria bacterium]